MKVNELKSLKGKIIELEVTEGGYHGVKLNGEILKGAYRVDIILDASERARVEIRVLDDSETNYFAPRIFAATIKGKIRVEALKDIQ